MLGSHLKMLFIIIAIFFVSVVFCGVALTVHAQSDLQTRKYRNMVIDLGNGLKTNARLNLPSYHCNFFRSHLKWARIRRWGSDPYFTHESNTQTVLSTY